MNKLITIQDKKYLQMLESKDGKVCLGDALKYDTIRLFLLKDEDGEFKPTGRAICTNCKGMMTASDGGLISRHVKNCERKRGTSGLTSDASKSNSENSEEPAPKQRKLQEFTKRQFSKDQVCKISKALAKHALLTGKSFNYVSSDAMKSLLIDTANATESGEFGEEAKAQIPCRKTIQKKAISLSDQLMTRAFEELKPYAGKRVHFMVDHGKVIGNYLSMFVSFIDEKFQLKVLPIGFTPSNDGKKAEEAARIIYDHIRCVSHSVHLLAERTVNPLETHQRLLSPEVLETLEKVALTLKNAQDVSSAIRLNIQVCGELSKLPTLPNDTRWLNGVKCLNDVMELKSEIQNVVSQLSLKGRTASYWLCDNVACVNSVLLILKPLLNYCLLFQSQKDVTIHHVLPAYKVLESKWQRFHSRDFSEIKDKDSFDLEVLQAMASAGMHAVNHYYSEFNDHHYGAVLLCPKTKLMTQFTSLEAEKAKQFVTDALPTPSTPTDSQPSSIPEYVREMSDKIEKPNKHNELKRYMEEFVNMESAETIEEYWSRKRLDFPALFEVAARTLSIVPSESSCETSFSTAAFLLDKRRSRLQYSTAEKVVV